MTQPAKIHLGSLYQEAEKTLFVFNILKANDSAIIQIATEML